MNVTRRAQSGRADLRRGQSGFTLIEVVVVIAILGILASIAVFAMDRMNHEASVQGCRVERRTLIAAMQAAENDGAPGDYLPYTGGEEPRYFVYSGGSWSEKPGVHPGPECPVP